MPNNTHSNCGRMTPGKDRFIKAAHSSLRNQIPVTTSWIFRRRTPTLLRFRAGFQVSSDSKTVLASGPSPDSVFWWNGDGYYLPADVVAGDVLQITGFDAAGRLRQKRLIKLAESTLQKPTGGGGGVPLFYRLSVNGHTLMQVFRSGD